MTLAYNASPTNNSTACRMVRENHAILCSSFGERLVDIKNS